MKVKKKWLSPKLKSTHIGENTQGKFGTGVSPDGKGGGGGYSS